MLSIHPFLSLLLFIFGACLGSFFSVVIYRTKHDIPNITLGRSQCANCKKKLHPKQLIPIFSYLLAKGKCLFCKKKISLKYPLIEVTSGITTLCAFFYAPFIFLKDNLEYVVNYDFFIQFAFILTIASLFIIIFFFDLFYMEIPMNILGINTIIILIYQILNYGTEISNFIIGAILFSLFFYIQYIITKKKGIGEGDIYLGATLGLLLGYELLLPTIFVSYTSGALIGIILKVFNPKLSKLPFAPFLIFGTLAALILEEKILNFII